MTAFVPKTIEGFEISGLPFDIYDYLRNRWIHFELGGPNANLASSWRGVTNRSIFTHLDHSYKAKQYRKTGEKMAPQPHRWKKSIL
jgi:hypothetical protein